MSEKRKRAKSKKGLRRKPRVTPEQKGLQVPEPEVFDELSAPIENSGAGEVQAKLPEWMLAGSVNARMPHVRRHPDVPIRRYDYSTGETS